MNKEEIEKLFKRIELDKASDSCGFEFADGYGCNFDNIATCYDDRLKLYELVKDLQKRINKAIDLYKNCKAEDYCTLDLDMYNALIDGDVDDNGNMERH